MSNQFIGTRKPLCAAMVLTCMRLLHCVRGYILSDVPGVERFYCRYALVRSQLILLALFIVAVTLGLGFAEDHSFYFSFAMELIRISRPFVLAARSAPDLADSKVSGRIWAPLQRSRWRMCPGGLASAKGCT